MGERLRTVRPANTHDEEIKIVPLMQCPQHITKLTKIWHDSLGEAWGPEYPPERMGEILHEQLNEDQIPLAMVALLGNEPVGMCCIRASDDIKPYIVPCLGALCVRSNLRHKGIGASLVEAAIKQTEQLGFARLYLFTVDLTIFKWYEKFGFYIVKIVDWENGTSSMLMERIISTVAAA